MARLLRCPTGRGLGAVILLGSALCAAMAGSAVAGESIHSRFPEAIKAIKPSVVAVGTLQVTRRPPLLFKGTGFVVADGNRVVTNAHVVDGPLDRENKEQLAIFIRKETKIESRLATVIKLNRQHDVAILKFEGKPLPPLKLSREPEIAEGTLVAFTGFPIGSVLGLYHVTHRGIISAYTPIAIPQLSSRQLDVKMIQQLQNGFFVYQLDATAYPGNSGSPLYDPISREVHGIVSSVFVKGTKERILQDPSGISYAIPIRYAIELMKGQIGG